MRLKVEYIPIDALKPYDKNAKIHTKEQAVDYETLTNNFWQMPIIEKTDFIPDDLIGFNYAKTSVNKKCGIHFYIDDYQFERVAKSDYSVSSDFFTNPRGKRVKADDNFADRYDKYRKYTKMSNEIYDRAIKRGLVQL